MTDSIKQAKVFFAQSEDDMTPYQEIANEIGGIVLRYSYQPYMCHSVANSVECSHLQLEEPHNSEVVYSRWYPKGNRAFPHTHARCGKCDAITISNPPSPPKKCSSCGADLVHR